MKYSTSIPIQKDSSPLLPILALTGGQVRQNWRFLALTAIGIITAVILVCVGSLYSQLVVNVSLQDFFRTNSNHSTILLQGHLNHFVTDEVEQITTQLGQNASKDIGPALSHTPQVFYQLGPLPIFEQQPSPTAGAEQSGRMMTLNGFAQAELAKHITITQGRLPIVSTTPEDAKVQEIEIAITPAIAQGYKLKLDDRFAIASPAENASDNDYWTLHVVGIFTVPNGTDPFWHGHANDFQPTVVNARLGRFSAICLTSSEALTHTMNNKIDFSHTPRIAWAYSINPTRVDTAQAQNLINGIKSFTDDASSAAADFSIDTTNTPVQDLERYHDHLTLAQVSIILLLILISGIILLFVVLMADLLIERRTATIALLRSRGASRRQIFGMFALQGLGLAVLAFLIGPLLALPITTWLAQLLLPPADQQVITFGSGNIFTRVMDLYPTALLVIIVALLTVLLAIARDINIDILVLRREAARSTHRPFWQRFYLDLLLVALSLGSYGYLLYTIDTAQLDAQSNIQATSPLVLVAAGALLLALLLLFLRLFPMLIRWTTGLASRRGSVASVLALAQMARLPRQAMRTTLLLTLATAFAVFALIFTATQNQRIYDIATYQVGADFSGSIPPTTASPSSVINSYRSIHGVASVMPGAMLGLTSADGSFAATVKAVDTDTFAQTALWRPRDSTQPLDTLVRQLRAYRATDQQQNTVAAIVDRATWQALHLQTGEQFLLTAMFSDPAHNNQSGTTVDIPFIAVAEVERIPTLDPDSSLTRSNLDHGDILVDYQTYNTVYTNIAKNAPAFVLPTQPLNYLWLHTQANTNLTTIRSALISRIQPGTLLYDRQAFIDTLLHDPFYLDLQGILLIGMVTPLVLALLGSLLSSWMNALLRLSTFALLRALGSAPRQIASMVSWEQGIVYIIMFLLGIGAGILLAVMVLPALILSNVVVAGVATNNTFSPTTGSSAPVQADLPTLQMVIPPSLGLLLGLLLLISVIVLGWLVYLVSRPSMSQTLRLNAD